MRSCVSQVNICMLIELMSIYKVQSQLKSKRYLFNMSKFSFSRLGINNLIIYLCLILL